MCSTIFNFDHLYSTRKKKTMDLIYCFTPIYIRLMIITEERNKVIGNTAKPRTDQQTSTLAYQQLYTHHRRP